MCLNAIYNYQSNRFDFDNHTERVEKYTIVNTALYKYLVRISMVGVLFAMVLLLIYFYLWLRYSHTLTSLHIYIPFFVHKVY